ncbi:MAG: MerR family transcriptional regulator, partial [Chloroflexia bacterium]|nr:MerR family transcriptional regulator [Chloroflexia bacterium]
MSPDRMTLAEITEQSNVSVRTVRYYIAEGLLPPPEGAGPGSAYTAAHLDRLRLIQRLKQAFLPLKEIRRRLTGLDDGDVRALLADDEVRRAVIAEDETRYDASLSGAREYLHLLESRECYRTEPLALSIPSASAQAMAAPSPATLDAPPHPARGRGPQAKGVFPARPVSEPAQPENDPRQPDAAGLW